MGASDASGRRRGLGQARLAGPPGAGGASWGLDLMPHRMVLLGAAALFPVPE